MAYKINHADILDWAKNYDGEPFDVREELNIQVVPRSLSILVGKKG